MEFLTKSKARAMAHNPIAHLNKKFPDPGVGDNPSVCRDWTDTGHRVIRLKEYSSSESIVQRINSDAYSGSVESEIVISVVFPVHEVKLFFREESEEVSVSDIALDNLRVLFLWGTLECMSVGTVIHTLIKAPQLRSLVLVMHNKIDGNVLGTLAKYDVTLPHLTHLHLSRMSNQELVHLKSVTPVLRTFSAVTLQGFRDMRLRWNGELHLALQKMSLGLREYTKAFMQHEVGYYFPNCSIPDALLVRKNTQTKIKELKTKFIEAEDKWWATKQAAAGE